MSLVDFFKRVSTMIDLYEEWGDKTAAIEGYLRKNEGFNLGLLAAYGPGVGAVVEIGSFKGRSTGYLALGLQLEKRGKLVAIDHFLGSPEHQRGAEHEDRDIACIGATYPAFVKNMNTLGVMDDVIVLRMSSADAAPHWDAPIRLLFIDGDHSYEQCRQDFENFEQYIEVGGVVCFHDVDVWDGVTCFFNETIQHNPKYNFAYQCYSLGVLTKIAG